MVTAMITLGLACISTADDRTPTTAAKTIAGPSPAELQANYPRFRGWDGSGAVAQTNFTLAYDQATGQGLAWKATIPGPGYASPVVWGNQVFLTGGTFKKKEVYCYALATGEMLWTRAVPDLSGQPPKDPKSPESTGVAASTGACDGQRFYAVFGNGDVAALNFDGTVAWSKNVGPLKNPYGHATSLAMWRDTLILQLDGGEAEPEGSKLMALAGPTGNLLWDTPHPSPITWATPIVIESSGLPRIITLGQPWVIAYSPIDGKEYWRAELLDKEIVPSPIFAGGLVIAVSPTVKLLGIRPNGTGNVTKSIVAWSAEGTAPDATSPVSDGKLVFTVSGGGLVTCRQVTNGRKVWEYDLKFPVESSPSIVGDKLFVLGHKGKSAVLAAGRKYKEISRSQFDDEFEASPAFADGRVLLRGHTNLYCLGSAPVTAKKPSADVR